MTQLILLLRRKGGASPPPPAGPAVTATGSTADDTGVTSLTGTVPAVPATPGNYYLFLYNADRTTLYGLSPVLSLVGWTWDTSALGVPAGDLVITSQLCDGLGVPVGDEGTQTDFAVPVKPDDPVAADNGDGTMHLTYMVPTGASSVRIDVFNSNSGLAETFTQDGIFSIDRPINPGDNWFTVTGFGAAGGAGLEGPVSDESNHITV